MSESKLQIRARLLSAIMELQSSAPVRGGKGSRENSFSKVIDSLRDIEDKTSVLEILVKELKKDNSEDKQHLLFCMMYELLQKEEVEKVLLKELANPALNDSIKTSILNILRGFGSHVNYDEFIQYLDDPENVIDTETTKLLSNAVVNPEAQIDFLDFANALPLSEAKMLVESLNNDFDGDNLANILSPLILSKPYSELAFEAIKALGTSKSMLALNTLEYLANNIENMQIKAHVQKNIATLKLAGVKENNAKKFYKEMLSNNPVYKCCVSLPDGHGNIGIIFSRKNERGYIQMFTAVISDTDGVIDAFGFNEITGPEFERIVSKFYSGDFVVEVSAVFCKYLLKNAEKISRKMYDEMSYEYVAWRTIINDIDYEDINFAKNAQKTDLSEKQMEELYEKGYFDKWFLDTDEGFVNFINKINDSKNPELLFNNPLPMTEVFDSKLIELLDPRLLKISYLLRAHGEEQDADIVYSLIYDSKQKNIFFENMLKKSVYEYFLKIKEEYYSLQNSTSIFTKKREEKNTDIKFVESAIAAIEENWI